MDLFKEEISGTPAGDIFRSTFEYSSIGMALVGTRGEWLDVNESLCSIVGYSKDELLPMTFQDITHPDDLETDLTLLGQLLSGGINSYEMEKRYFHKRGHIVWILLTVSLVRKADHSPRFFISQIQDISDKKETATQLAESRMALDSVLSNTKTIIARLDRDCRHLYINDAIENETGRSASTLIGKTFAEANVKDEYAFVIADKVQAVFATQLEQHAELTVKLNGDTRYYYTNFTPEFGANGEVETVMIVTTNVTKLKLAEKELINAAAEINDLQSILPICSYCRNIRDDDNYWHTVENYISSHTSTEFSHGICPSCYTNLVEPEIEKSLKRVGNTP